MMYQFTNFLFSFIFRIPFHLTMEMLPLHGKMEEVPLASKGKEDLPVGLDHPPTVVLLSPNLVRITW